MRLKWSQLNFAERMVYFRGSTSKNSRTRGVPLSDRAIFWLRKLPRYLGSEYAFVNSRTGDRIKNPDKTLHRVVTRVGLGWVGFHDFRRFRATTWLKNGLTVDEIRRLLGHASVETTQRYFLEADLVGQVRAAQRRETKALTGNKPASAPDRKVG